MWILALAPFFLQMIAIGIDEIYFHYRRGLPKWERIGHPLDTLSYLACLLIAYWLPFDQTNLKIYIAFCIISCLMITKDEFVHKDHCPGAENWLHALLFILHPLTLAVVGIIWPISQNVEIAPWLQWLDQPEAWLLLKLQVIAIALFFCYQLIFWNFIWKNRPVIKF